MVSIDVNDFWPDDEKNNNFSAKSFDKKQNDEALIKKTFSLFADHSWAICRYYEPIMGNKWYKWKFIDVMPMNGDRTFAKVCKYNL